jgi:putative hemolysin
MGDSEPFITKKSVIDLFHIKPWLASIVMSGMKINKLNRFVKSLEPYDSVVELLQKALHRLNIIVEFDVRWIDELKGQPYITVSNHAFGLLDGVAFVSKIGPKSPKYRITANYLLSSINTVKGYTIPVNPFDHKTIKSKKLGATQASLDWLSEGNPVGLFPAGEVATRQKESREITESVWKLGSFRLIRLAKVPVVPIYLSGTNSKWFHFVGKIHPLLRTWRMIKEFFNKRNTTVLIKPGKIIYPEEYLEMDDQEMRDFFRSAVLSLK